jgi:hypothetical protein
MGGDGTVPPMAFTPPDLHPGAEPEATIDPGGPLTQCGIPARPRSPARTAGGDGP